jgi:hypothetical protein
METNPKQELIENEYGVAEVLKRFGIENTKLVEALGIHLNEKIGVYLSSKEQIKTSNRQKKLLMLLQLDAAICIGDGGESLERALEAQIAIIQNEEGLSNA